MSDDEFNLLPTQLKRRAERERKRLKTRFEYLKCITELRFEGGQLTESEFIWASAILKTRLMTAPNLSFSPEQRAIPWLEFNEKFDRSILAPFFDMLNHSERENC